jgi:hypothetical protein
MEIKQMTILEEMRQMRDETQYSVHKDIYARAVLEMESLYRIIDTMANRANDIRCMGKVKLLQSNHIICEDEDGTINLD